MEYKRGNILMEKGEVEALVNTVNCVGIMGRGIALRFKKAFPENFNIYAEACKHGEVQLGKMFIFDFDTKHKTQDQRDLQISDQGHPRYIINFPTKNNWRNKSRIADIEKGLKSLIIEIKKRNIKSIAIPPLGSGLGGLRWAEVRNLIEDTFRNIDDVRVIVYEPTNESGAGDVIISDRSPQMTPGRAVMVSLIHRYMCALLDPYITLLEIHKLMYFMQQGGMDLKLQYKQAPHGPYAENLRHVLHEVEGYFTSGYADGGDDPSKEIQLWPGAMRRAERFLERDSKTRELLGGVINLVDGFESSFGLELLSTVHWIIKKKHISDTELVKEFYDWGPSKKKFNERQIALAYKTLQEKGWLDDNHNTT